MNPYWAVVQTETHREQVACHFLQLHGYTLYMPKIRVRRAGARTPIAQSLFPNYAFVAIELQWHSARWSPGVVRLVMDGERPARVPDAAIAELKAMERDGYIRLEPPQSARLERGDQVKILKGPFTGRHALFDGMRPHERVAVLLELLGGRLSVELAKGDVAKSVS
jgi:transcriptional antiterminator RfaH